MTNEQSTGVAFRQSKGNPLSSAGEMGGVFMVGSTLDLGH